MPTDEQRRAYAEAYAKAVAAWPGAMAVFLLGEPRPPEVTAVAEVLGLNPDVLGWHVEAEHGHEPHDENYERHVWEAAECDDPEHLRKAEERVRRRETAAGALAGPPKRQVRVQRRRERRRR